LVLISINRPSNLKKLFIFWDKIGVHKVIEERDVTEIRRWLSSILEMLLWLVAMLTLLQVLFGASFAEFFGIDIVNNIGLLVAKFGNAGLVGVIAAGVVAYLITRERPRGTRHSVSSEPPQ
jgi:hypothetical protein